MIKIYNRKTKQVIEERENGDNSLKYLYNHRSGRLILKLLINPIFSRIYGIYKKTFFSKYAIKKFINKNSIDINKFEVKNYKSFNDFFTRKLKKEYLVKKYDKNDFISPAESKLSVYKINKDLRVNIKGSLYTIDELIQDDIDNSYIDGNCLIFRLSVDNYHRYCHIDDGKLIYTKKIEGKLHTVRSISSNYKIYKENKRVVSKLKTNNFGELFYIEVGALLVGDIINYDSNTFKKGEEKGYFNIGGSTIVILTKKNIKIDEDIINYTNQNIEVLIEYGEKIGILK